MKKLLLLSTIFILSSLIVSAQTPAPTPTPKLDVKTVIGVGSGGGQGVGSNYSGTKPVSGGILNGKAHTLVRPKYPAAARAVKAEGTVSVQVVIDENGDVISASAVSGHPLLRQASEQAARESKFSPTTLEGQPVKVAGIITYNFVGPSTPKSISEIGFELAILEKAQTVPTNTSTYEISSNLPSEWTEEKEKFKDFYEKPEPPAESVQPSSSSDSPVKTEVFKTGNVSGVQTVQGVPSMRLVTSDYSSERSKVGAEIIEKIEIRLASNPDLLWKFKTGTILGRIAAQNENETIIKEEASNLDAMISSAPSTISATTLESLRKLVDKIQSGSLDEHKKAEIGWQTKALKIL